jgi:hypothetical protein
MGCIPSRPESETEADMLSVGVVPIYASEPGLISEPANSVNNRQLPIAVTTIARLERMLRFTDRFAASKPVASSSTIPGQRSSSRVSPPDNGPNSNHRSQASRLLPITPENEAETLSKKLLLNTELNDAPSASLSLNIAAVMSLLREMYSLDFKVYGNQFGRREDVGARNQQIGEANLLFKRIMETLDSWITYPSEYGWTKAELDVIKEIRARAKGNDLSQIRNTQVNPTTFRS